jgi:tetratricopeptide (TPR) repeat protein
MRHGLLGITTAMLIVGGASVVQGQAQGGNGAGVFPFSNARATAIAEYKAAIEASSLWDERAASKHVRRAFEADSSYALARAWYAGLQTGPNYAAELTRAAVDGANGPVGEALMLQAFRATGAANEIMWNAVVQLYPNDPWIAVQRAGSFAGQMRRDALREVVKKFPNSVSAKIALAYYVALPVQPTMPKEQLDEALNAAQEAARLAPSAPNIHTVMAFVLERMGREDEALEHLKIATSAAEPSFYTFEVRAEIQVRKSRFPEARASLDSAMLLNGFLPNRVQYLTTRAFLSMHEGNFAEAVAAMNDAIRDAQANGQTASVASEHLLMAYMYAAANDVAGIEQHLALAHSAGSTEHALNDAKVICYGLTKQGEKARKALEGYKVTSLQALAPATRELGVHRLTGLTLLAEGKNAEAIEELKQGGLNVYSQIGIIEAFLAMGKKKEAAAERAAFNARTDWTAQSGAAAVLRFRALKK